MKTITEKCEVESVHVLSSSAVPLLPKLQTTCACMMDLEADFYMELMTLN